MEDCVTVLEICRWKSEAIDKRLLSKSQHFLFLSLKLIANLETIVLFSVLTQLEFVGFFHGFFPPRFNHFASLPSTSCRLTLTLQLRNIANLVIVMYCTIFIKKAIQSRGTVVKSINYLSRKWLSSLLSHLKRQVDFQLHNMKDRHWLQYAVSKYFILSSKLFKPLCWVLS